MSPLALRILVSIVFGALAGGVTNFIAVWMLFHPYEPPRLFGRPLRLLQGAIPKNKARLASSMGRTVGRKLLTPEDLAKTVAEPGFREAFEERMSVFVASLFDRRLGSISEMLPSHVQGEIRSLLEEIASAQVIRLREYLGSDEFRDRAHGWADQLATEFRDKPLSSILTPEREDALADVADRWISDAVGSSGFERTIRDTIDRGAERLLVPDRTFQQLLPLGLVAAVERAISGYMPIALERLAGLLDDPEARRKVKRVLHELLDRFMRDLKFHQRIVAAFIVTPETIDRVLRAVEEEGAAKIAEILQDPAVRDAMARGVNNAIVDFLDKPVVSVLGDSADPSVVEAKDTLASWGLRLARDEQTRGYLVEKLRSTLTSAEQRTLGDLFHRIPPDKVADTIVSAVRSDRATEFYDDAAKRLIEFIMMRPIGRLGDRVPADAPARLEKALIGPFWSWIQDQVPGIAQRVDIAAKVEAKILEFPTAQVEALIRGVTERELKLIVRLGYVLGAVIGLVSAAVSLVFG